MKKISFTLWVLAFVCGVHAQEILHLYSGSNVVFEKSINDVDSIKFQAANSVFNFGTDYMMFPISEVDSITFSNDSLLSGTDIYITWNGTTATVINPLSGNGVDIVVDGALVDVTASSGVENLVYHLSGSTTNGRLYITPSEPFTLSLEGVSITNTSGAAINVLVNQDVNVILANASQNYLTDGNSSSYKGALQSNGTMIFNGSGTLTATGVKKNAIYSDKEVRINSGTIVIPAAEGDGFHTESFYMSGGTLNVTTTGDGIDAGAGIIQINDGMITVNTPGTDSKSIKCDSNMVINGGTFVITNSGDQTKGLKSKKDITINGGTFTITSSGTTVVENADTDPDPSHCTSIACDGTITINDGIFNLTLPATNSGGRGIKGDDVVTINGGTLNITTEGPSTVYTLLDGTNDSYSSHCIKSDVSINMQGGNITLVSTGTGGKGITSDGTIIFGALNANDSLLNLNVTTSGAHLLVTAASSWNADDADYANPKAIKAQGNLYVNSGLITVNCTQSTEGGECLESKDTLHIYGGQLALYSAYDDAINAANHIRIAGGTTYAGSGNNDAIDCNGTISISGGLTIAASQTSPEEAFDCDNNTFSITGGTIVGTQVSGSMSSSPTASACTQHSLSYTGSSNNSVQIIRSSDNAEILTFHIPTIGNTGGGGGPGGQGGQGGSNAVMIFSSPDLTAGSYTLKYGGTISGGTDFHNYYTGATYTGGSTKTFTVGSSYSITTVQ